MSEERLRNFTIPERETVAVHGKGYSRFVKFMRVALPVLALVIIVGVVVWMNMSDPEQATTAVAEEDKKGNTEMLNPEFKGLDEKHQTYTITADKAYNDLDDEQIMQLTHPIADIELNDGSWVAVKSGTGEYRKLQSRLFLQETVTLFHDLGYEAVTEDLLIDIKAGTALGEKPIAAHGPKGTLNASGIQVADMGKTIIFSGPVKLMLR